MDAPKSTVCTYYLAGNCAYGDKCRYDHVRPKVRRAHPKIPRASSDARARPAYPDGGDRPRAQRCVDVAGGHVPRVSEISHAPPTPPSLPRAIRAGTGPKPSLGTCSQVRDLWRAGSDPAAHPRREHARGRSRFRARGGFS